MLLAFSYLLHSNVPIKTRCVHNRVKTIRWHGISLSMSSLPWDAWCVKQALGIHPGSYSYYPRNLDDQSWICWLANSSKFLLTRLKTLKMFQRDFLFVNNFSQKRVHNSSFTTPAWIFLEGPTPRTIYSKAGKEFDFFVTHSSVV